MVYKSNRQGCEQDILSFGSYCSRNGISVNVKGGNGYVLSQSVPSGANIEDVNSITITAGGNTSSSSSSSSSSSNTTTDDVQKGDDEILDDALPDGDKTPVTPPKEPDVDDDAGNEQDDTPTE